MLRHESARRKPPDRSGRGLSGTKGTVSVRGGSTAWALVGGQALTAAVAGLVVWIGWGAAAALAAMFGGIVVILPTLYFAAKVYLRAGNATAAEVLGTFYRAEAMKLVLT